MAQDTAYKQNPLLKQRGVNIDFTKEQVKEVIRCSQDPEYFLSEYIKVISLDDGIIPFHPYPFQQKLIDSFHNNRFTICKLPRQSGKSVTVTAYLIHQAIFRDSQRDLHKGSGNHLGGWLAAQLLTPAHIPFLGPGWVEVESWPGREVRALLIQHLDRWQQGVQAPCQN